MVRRIRINRLSYFANLSQDGKIATCNPLADFPKLTGFKGQAGFAHVDPDGVYRAYLADGMIVDAARLTSEQVQTFVDARAPHLPEEDAARERQLYAGVDGQNVPDAQLLNPAEELKPTKYLEMFPEYSSCIRDKSPFDGKVF